MVKRILDDPLWIGLGGLRDHQIGTPLKSSEEMSKWQKGCLRISLGYVCGLGASSDENCTQQW
jgi:hypothetical protein